MYQIKLSRAAKHEPVRGVWCRVCETCYKSRDGYNDHNGHERNHFPEFFAARRKMVDKAYLEVSRLEKRLTRLTQLLANPPPPPPQESITGNFRWSLSNPLSSGKNHLRNLEQSIVTWEDDATVIQCPFCQQPFTQYSFRRHHCRICGRVVCGDPGTGCSTEIALNVDPEKTGNPVGVDVRMCKDCQHAIFSKSDFAQEIALRPPDQRAYENLIQFERGIRLLLPRFQRLLSALQDPDESPTPAQLTEATKVRKRMMDAFTQYDVAARRIRDLETDSPTQAKLQKAIYAQATSFLHLHMLPLKSLPKLMRHARPALGSSNGSSQRPQSALAAIKYNESLGAPPNGGLARPGLPSPAPSTTSSQSTALNALESEEKELRERMIVLEEQKFFVQEMIADANKRRRFDEVAALAQNVDDLSKEIDGITGKLASLDFAGVYSAGTGEIGGG